MKRLIMIVALALVSTGAWGNSYGIGDGRTIGCDSVVTSMEQGNEEFQRYFSWVMGYVSAANLYIDPAFNRSSVLDNKKRRLDFTLVGLAGHCTENPLDTLADAAEVIVERLIKKE